MHTLENFVDGKATASESGRHGRIHNFATGEQSLG